MKNKPLGAQIVKDNHFELQTVKYLHKIINPQKHAYTLGSFISIALKGYISWIELYQKLYDKDDKLLDVIKNQLKANYEFEAKWLNATGSTMIIDPNSPTGKKLIFKFIHEIFKELQTYGSSMISYTNRGGNHVNVVQYNKLANGDYESILFNLGPYVQRDHEQLTELQKSKLFILQSQFNKDNGQSVASVFYPGIKYSIDPKKIKDVLFNDITHSKLSKFANSNVTDLPRDKIKGVEFKEALDKVIVHAQRTNTCTVKSLQEFLRYNLSSGTFKEIEDMITGLEISDLMNIFRVDTSELTITSSSLYRGQYFGDGYSAATKVAALEVSLNHFMKTTQLHDHYALPQQLYNMQSLEISRNQKIELLYNKIINPEILNYGDAPLNINMLLEANSMLENIITNSAYDLVDNQIETIFNEWINKLILSPNISTELKAYVILSNTAAHETVNEIYMKLQRVDPKSEIIKELPADISVAEYFNEYKDWVKQILEKDVIPHMLIRNDIASIMEDMLNNVVYQTDNLDETTGALLSSSSLVIDFTITGEIPVHDI